MGMQWKFGTLAMAAVLASGAASAQKVQMSDAQVEATVLKAMAADASLTSQPIQSSTAFGVVTLTGAVSTDASRDRAEQIASRTEGVKKVVDQLSVGPQAVASANSAGPAQAAAQNNTPSNTPANDPNFDPAAQNVLPSDSSGPATGSQQNGSPQNGSQQPLAQPDQQVPANTPPVQYPLPGQGDGPIGSQAQPSPQNYPQTNYPQNGQNPQQGYPQGQ